MCIYVLPALICTLCIPGVCRAQKRIWDHLELSLQTAVSCLIVHIMLGINPKTLEEQHLFLTAKTSF